MQRMHLEQALEEFEPYISYKSVQLQETDDIMKPFEEACNTGGYDTDVIVGVLPGEFTEKNIEEGSFFNPDCTLLRLPFFVAFKDGQYHLVVSVCSTEGESAKVNMPSIKKFITVSYGKELKNLLNP